MKEKKNYLVHYKLNLGFCLVPYALVTTLSSPCSRTRGSSDFIFFVIKSGESFLRPWRRMKDGESSYSLLCHLLLTACLLMCASTARADGSSTTTTEIAGCGFRCIMINAFIFFTFSLFPLFFHLLGSLWTNCIAAQTWLH